MVHGTVCIGFGKAWSACQEMTFTKFSEVPFANLLVGQIGSDVCLQRFLTSTWFDLARDMKSEWSELNSGEEIRCGG